MKKLALGAVLSLILALTGCGGGSMITPPPPPPPPPPTVTAAVTVNSTTSGPFDLAMSTSFQPAEWDYTFFQQFPAHALTPLETTFEPPSHIRLQGISQGVPQDRMARFTLGFFDAGLPSRSRCWVLGITVPEFQIAKGAGVHVSATTTTVQRIRFLDLTFQQFAGYAQNLVQYYNTGGFTPPGGNLLVSPAYPNDKITWWGIYNEPASTTISTAYRLRHYV